MILADEVYGDLAYDGPVRADGQPRARCARSSRSRASRRRISRRAGAPAGWWSAATPRLDELLAAIKKLADGRLCSNGPMQYAIAPALTRRPHRTRSRSARRCASARTLTDRAHERDSRHELRRRRAAAFYAMPQVALPPGRHRRAVHPRRCCVRRASCACTARASACRPTDGYFRIVFLASPSELDGDLRRHRAVHARATCTRDELTTAAAPTSEHRSRGRSRWSASR